MYSFVKRKHPLLRFLLPVKGVDIVNIEVDIHNNNIDRTGQVTSPFSLSLIYFYYKIQYCTNAKYHMLNSRRPSRARTQTHRQVSAP
jgi:hypothetical protein